MAAGVRDRLTLLLYLFLGMVGLYMLSPLILIIVDSFSNSTFGQFPPPGFTLRWYIRMVLEVPEFRRGLTNSVLVASGATALAVPLGTLASYGLVRYHFRLREGVRSFLLLPITMPSIVFGAALFLFYIRAGLYGTRVGMVLAHALLGIPFVATIVTANLHTLGRDYEEAAMDLGANPLVTFFTVTIPSIRTGLIVSALFAFIISFDQVDVSIFLTRPRVNTLPIEMFIYAENYQDPTLSAISTLMIAFTVVLVFAAVALLRTQEYRRLIERQGGGVG
jgi:putative spermidine/putrescine transport system permease protein